jgi:molecular chaperone DnaJ
MAEDLYATLNVSKDASPDELKKSFRKLAVENHPDKHKGCKEKEEKFKAINQAYSILSDPQKRAGYDKFGTVDDNGPPPDLSEILKSMFGGAMGGGGGMPGMGGGMPGGMPGGFSFVFMDGAGGGGGGMPEMGGDIFEQIFGGGGGHRKAQQQQRHDIVDVAVDICDIYYGNNKRVEFELLELCSMCQGSGASDPSQIMKCITCKGNGEVIQQIGPFMNKLRCPSCNGNGSAIKKVCNGCKGQKTLYTKKAFDLKLPKGIPHNHEVRMSGRGSYNPQTKQNKDMIFKFKHSIHAPYKLDDSMNVLLTVPITIEELVGGFIKTIKLYRDDVTLTSDRYFNPLNPIIMKEKGIYDMRTNNHTDLHLHFHVEFIDSDKLVKYKDIFHKIFKKNNDALEGSVINIHDL